MTYYETFPFTNSGTAIDSTTSNTSWPFTGTDATASVTASTYVTNWPVVTNTSIIQQARQHAYVWEMWVDESEKRKENRTQRRARERKEAEEKRLAEERRQAQMLAAQEEAKRKAAIAEVANKRAEELLRSVLSPEQERAWNENKAFYVVGNKTKKRYKIDNRSHGNLTELDEKGKVVAGLCVYVPGVPTADHVAAQKLMLECNEEELLRVANRTQYAAPR